MSSKKERETFGRKLKRLRKEEGLTIDDLARQTGLKRKYLEDLEEEKALPHVAEILRLARTLSVDPTAFVGDKQAGTSPGKKKKALTTRTDDYAYQTLTDDQPDMHLMGFRVTIDPKSEHKKVGYKHEGEEFIYVISGKLQLKVGGKQRTLKEGESIRFDSGVSHQLKNPGDEPCLLVVVIYTP